MRAVSAYTEARTINRHVYGLLNEDQIPLMDRISDVMLELNKPAEAQAHYREAMRLAMQKPSEGGGSRLSPEEILKRFDKNGDGQLDESERAAMREATGSRPGRGESGARRENRGNGNGRPSLTP